MSIDFFFTEIKYKRSFEINLHVKLDEYENICIFLLLKRK